MIDESGKIQFVNKGWVSFGEDNDCTISNDWSDVNYIEVCDKSSAMGDDYGTQAALGIRKVIEDPKHPFYFEYPCHSPTEKRWFMMRITPFQVSVEHYFVISHQNITERKLAEKEVENLARMDGLTNIPNRRVFDDFVQNEWKRCSRLNKTICLAIVDLDYFKLLNDHCGHQAGDDCLVKVAGLLEGFANRPSDIFARYGGEEFVLVWGDTSIEQARLLCNKLLKTIENLHIKNQDSPVNDYLTVSIGLAEMVPNQKSNETELIACADKNLYKAKDMGRNRVEG